MDRYPDSVCQLGPDPDLASFGPDPDLASEHGSFPDHASQLESYLDPAYHL